MYDNFGTCASRKETCIVIMGTVNDIREREFVVNLESGSDVGDIEQRGVEIDHGQWRNEVGPAGLVFPRQVMAEESQRR